MYFLQKYSNTGCSKSATIYKNISLKTIRRKPEFDHWGEVEILQVSNDRKKMIIKSEREKKYVIYFRVNFEDIRIIIDCSKVKVRVELSFCDFVIFLVFAIPLGISKNIFLMFVFLNKI